jgi:DNA-directed RNA polymerase subunit M/transcription elongation factor TFIIS
MMEKITRRQIADAALARWKDAYPKDRWPDKQETTAKLAYLGKGAPYEKINEAIGNTSWTRLECDECGKDDCDYVTLVGQKPDYDTRFVYLCKSCIQKMYQLSE